MKRSTFCIAAFVLFAFHLPVYGAEVLIITWQGKLASEPAFEKKLKSLRPDVTYKYLDAKRSKRELASQLRGYDFSTTDLVYSFGTNGTRTVKQFLKGRKPIVFNVVSTPVLCKIANSLEKPGGNLTGARLLADFKLQMDILLKVKSIKKMAIWFDPREKQSITAVQSIQGIAKTQGIEIVLTRVIPDTPNFEKKHARHIKQAENVDAIYVVAHSSYVSNAQKLFSKVKQETLLVGSMGLFARLGTSIAIGPEMSERGEAAAELANQILSGASAGNIPVRTVTKDETVLFVNRGRTAAIDETRIRGLGVKVVYVDTKL